MQENRRFPDPLDRNNDEQAGWGQHNLAGCQNPDTVDRVRFGPNVTAGL